MNKGDDPLHEFLVALFTAVWQGQELLNDLACRFGALRDAVKEHLGHEFEAVYRRRYLAALSSEAKQEADARISRLRELSEQLEKDFSD